MKKSKLLIIGIFLFVLIILGVLTNYIDSGRVTTNHEPKFCIKTINKDGNKITYYGLGYKVIRYVAVSPSEPYEQNTGVKMGSWFMKYERPTQKVVTIKIRKREEEIEIKPSKDIDRIYDILANLKYEEPTCDGIVTHEIIIDKEKFYLKENCKAVQFSEKQSFITQEDLDTILKIIEENE